MKRLFYSFVILCFYTNSLSAQASYQFQHFSMGSTSDNVFTSNNFKCVAVGKGNRIWAGTQVGGLYVYNDRYNIWSKSDKLTNVYINDIKADGDSGIWIAQGGTSNGGTVQSNTAGGVNYFPDSSDQVMNFYTVTDYSLTSRNAKSIFLDSSYRVSQGELPRPWVALGTYITSGNTKKGGLNIGLNAQSPYFDNIPWGFAILGTPVHICESIGGNSQEVWVGSRLNQGGSKIIRYRTEDKQFIGYIHENNTPAFQAGFSAQAIFFDSRRDAWVGLKQGGLRVFKDGQWYAMNSVMFFDAGTQVNFNAITEDEFGNVYIGTSNGLLMYNSPKYNPSSNPDNATSYKLFKTTDGLLNDNVTGLAYDKKNGKLIIASSGGVSFLKIKYPHIHGKMLNASTGINGTDSTTSGYKTKPFEVLGRVKAILYKNGEEKEIALSQADGSFELKEADDTSSYTVEVRYNLPDTTIKFIYENVRNHTLLEPTLFPVALMGEINALIPKLKERCFPFKLFFGIPSPIDICTNKGFKTTGYTSSYDWVINPNGITSEHTKHVDNLANYYASLGTLYNLGGQMADITFETSSVFLDGIEALIGEFSSNDAIKKADTDGALAAASELSDEGWAAISSLKEGLVYGLTKAVSYVKNDAVKKYMEICITACNDAFDLFVTAKKDGMGEAAQKAFKDNFKKLFAQAIATFIYDQYYAQTLHANFVPEISMAAHNLESGISYEEAFDQLYSPYSQSLVKLSTDTLIDAKATMTTLVNASKVADAVNAGLDIVSYLGIIPGGQALAAAARALSYASKAMKYFMLAGAVLQGSTTAVDVAEMSTKIQGKAQLERFYEISNTSYSNTQVETSLDSLTARKNRYNQKLTELQSIYAAGSFDLNNFKIKRSQLKIEDSLFTAELRTVLNSVFSIADTASEVITNFSARQDRIMDTFVDYQSVLKRAYYYRNIAFVAENDKSVDRSGIDSVINELKITNDSLVNALGGLVTDINNSSINAKAFLVRDGYSINFSRVPGSSGTVTYSFKNYGGEPQNNVSFKITDVEKGYIITGTDSVNVGIIQPGETKSVTFHFTSPMHDSLSHYNIKVNANNGRFQNESGVFYTIDPNKCYSAKDGNWNDPATWECGVVPGPTTPVVIAHKVKVTANASCKNVSLHSKDAELKVEPGKQFTVMQ